VVWLLRERSVPRGSDAAAVLGTGPEDEVLIAGGGGGKGSLVGCEDGHGWLAAGGEGRGLCRVHVSREVTGWTLVSGGCPGGCCCCQLYYPVQYSVGRSCSCCSPPPPKCTRCRLLLLILPGVVISRRSQHGRGAKGRGEGGASASATPSPAHDGNIRTEGSPRGVYLYGPE